MAVIQRITQIDIENVRGIANASFPLEILPNIPSILVAPNGFGKSSIASAFASLRPSRMEVHKDQLHKGNENLKPLLRLRWTELGGAHVATEAHGQGNGIAAEFDVHVINSQLVPKARKHKIGGTTTATASIEVEPIVFIKSVPEKVKLPYDLAGAKAQFGKNGRVLPSIAHVLSTPAVLAEIGREVDFSKVGQVGATKAVQSLADAINAASGTVPAIVAAVPFGVCQTAMNVPHLGRTVAVLKAKGINFATDVEYCLAAIQVASIWTTDRVAFRKAVDFAKFAVEKAAYESAFSALKSTWKDIKPKQTKEGLVIDFPKAVHISNGERDAISFLAQVKQAKIRFRKERCILVIDEIFDYLDDANLVACQYYLTALIAEMKADGRQLFPLILTHLNPTYFRTFAFSNQKVLYLDKAKVTDPKVEKIILARDELPVKAVLSRHFLHYDPTPATLVPEFAALNLEPGLADSQLFYSHVFDELKKYREDKQYDPIAVCCAVRIGIERLVYQIVPAPEQAKFLSTFKTGPKLQFAQNVGVQIPEVMFLLGIIYNEASHLRPYQDNFSPLVSKLSNLTIKHMITSTV